MKLPIIPIHKIIRLSSKKRLLLARSVFLLAAASAALRLLSFRSTMRYLGKIGFSDDRRRRASSAEIEDVVWALDVTKRYMTRSSCLSQALAARLFLARHGYNSDLRIGVKKNPDNTVSAHAWIERRGAVLIGYIGNLDQYKPLSGAGFNG